MDIAGSHLDPLNLYEDKSQAGLYIMKEQFELTQKLLKWEKYYQDGKLVTYEKMINDCFNNLNKGKNNDLCTVFQSCIILNDELKTLLKKKEVSDVENIVLSQSIIEIIESMVELSQFPDNIEIIDSMKENVVFIAFCIKQIKTNENLNLKKNNYTNDISVISNETMYRLILQKPFDNVKKSKDKGIGLLDNRVIWGLKFAISYFTLIILYNTIEDWNKWSKPYAFSMFTTYIDFIFLVIGGIKNISIFKVLATLNLTLLLSLPMYYNIFFGFIGRKDIADNITIIYEQFRGILDALGERIFKDELADDFLSFWQDSTKVHSELYKDYENDIKEYYNDMIVASKTINSAIKSFKNLPEEFKVPEINIETQPGELALIIEQNIQKMNELSSDISNRLYLKYNFESITDVKVLKQMEQLSPEMFSENSAVSGLLEIVDINKKQYMRKLYKGKQKIETLQAKITPDTKEYVPYLHGRSMVEKFLKARDPVIRGHIDETLQKVKPLIPSKQGILEFNSNLTIGLGIFILILYMISFLRSFFVKPKQELTKDEQIKLLESKIQKLEQQVQPRYKSIAYNQQ